MNIPFNKPYTSGKELYYIKNVISKGHFSGNGSYTKKCQSFLEEKYSLKKVFLTTSCTDALEMCALLIDVHHGDEIIMPSYTFVSTALAFVRQGARIVFADSEMSTPNIDVNKIEDLITPKTKAIVVVHYAGIACEMEEIMKLSAKYNLYIIEDTAQAIDSFYEGKPLGSIGHLSAMSFHETKNLQCGEGGCLIVNDDKFLKRAEIIWEKGTNRAEFFRGEINKYGWVDIGSSFLPSELNAAFLYAQLENLDEIQNKRKLLWKQYYEGLSDLEKLGYFKIQIIPEYATNNAHMFYILCNSEEDRIQLISFLKKRGISASFHYQSLHMSSFYHKNHDGRKLIMSEVYTNRLLRLPMYYDLRGVDIKHIIKTIKLFFIKNS